MTHVVENTIKNFDATNVKEGKLFAIEPSLEGLNELLSDFELIRDNT